MLPRPDGRTCGRIDAGASVSQTIADRREHELREVQIERAEFDVRDHHRSSLPCTGLPGRAGKRIPLLKYSSRA